MTSASHSLPLAAYGLPALHDPEQETVNVASLHACTSIDIHCVTPWAALKAEPRGSAATVSEAIFGEPLQLLDRHAAWIKVAAVSDGYSGWMLAGATAKGFDQPTHRISVPMAHVYRGPDLKTEPLMPLPMGAFLEVSSDAPSGSGFLALSTGGYVFAKHVTPLGKFAGDPVAVAEGFLGAPYLWGGRTKIGIDCSGLVQVSLSASGKRVLRDSGSQFRSIGRALESSETPARGDLAFFPGHVGWMIDDSNLLHANATHMAVTVDPLAEVIEWVRQSGEQEPFLGFRRL